MNPIIVVPARMASVRLPGKPLADIHGQPMIVHVLARAAAAGVGPVLCAAGDADLVDAVDAAGFDVVLTDPDLPSGSDRVWAAVQAVDPDGKHDVIVNLQGDLPTLEPDLIEAVIAPLENADVDIATLVTEITDEAEKTDPDTPRCIAPITDNAPCARALYFTRGAAPWGDGPVWHHIGIYAYRRAALERFVGLPPGVLEQREKLEQLRALEAGMRIDAARVDTVPLGVDTPADLDRARRMLDPARP